VSKSIPVGSESGKTSISAKKRRRLISPPSWTMFVANFVRSHHVSTTEVKKIETLRRFLSDIMGPNRGQSPSTNTYEQKES
jgi:hypothetical protein